MRFAFQRFEVEPRRRELRADGRPVALGGRAFDLLLALLEARGAVVAKDELLSRVWPGIVVEECNLQAQVSALRRALGPEGGRLVANVPRRGYRFAGELREDPSHPPPAAQPGDNGAQPPPTLPDQPSLAVLPFLNLGADQDDGYFAEGMAEELTTALGRFGWLFVVARNSSFAYRGDPAAVDTALIGRELGVRYVVLGSVRRAGDRVRVVARLVEAATRRQVWAERFDGGAEDVFELQDRVSASVVGAIEPRLRRVEAARARAKPTESLAAYDLYLRALGHLFPYSEANYAEALAQLEAAVALDPGFALALALAAHCHMTRCAQGWAGGDAATAVRLAENALAKAPDEAEVLTHAAVALAFFGHGLEPSIQLVRRALELNPNLAWAWFTDGWLRLHADQPDAAIERFAKALRLSPLDPMLGGTAAGGTAHAYLLGGQVEAAVEWARRAVREAPDYAYTHRVLAAALAHAGRLPDAAAASEGILRVEPGFTIRGYLSRAPLRDTPALRQLAAGLRLAGLPGG
jgi:TolB-like protein/Tfp pilus assembly protein PilF